MTDRDRLRSLVGAFNPHQELHPGDTRYVDCAAERGADELLDQMENHIRLNAETSSQIFGGHRGGGKTTELFRLKRRLEEGGENYLISHCEADNYFHVDSVELSDVLMAIIQQLWTDAEMLNIHLTPNRVKAVLREIWQVLNRATPNLDKINVKSVLAEFSFLITNSSDNRALVRQYLRSRTPNLIEAVNEIVAKTLDEARQRGYQGLIVIVDNLDRMSSLEPGPSGRLRYVELFIDSANTLRSVACHKIYVAPTTLLHSTELANIASLYGAEAKVLPMVPISTRDRQPFGPGMAKMVEMVEKRMRYAGIENVFDSSETIRRLAEASGGYIRALMTLATAAFTLTRELPVTGKQVDMAIRQNRDALLVATRNKEIEDALREVAQTQEIQNTPIHLRLLEYFLVLEYYDKGYWYDLSPALKETYLPHV